MSGTISGGPERVATGAPFCRPGAPGRGAHPRPSLRGAGFTVARGHVRNRRVAVDVSTGVTGVAGNGDGTPPALEQGPDAGQRRCHGVRRQRRFRHDVSGKRPRSTPGRACRSRRTLETGAADIDATGDVAAGFDVMTGGRDVHAIRPTANERGRVAPLNMTGGKTACRSGPDREHAQVDTLIPASGSPHSPNAKIVETADMPRRSAGPHLRKGQGGAPQGGNPSRGSSQPYRTRHRSGGSRSTSRNARSGSRRT